MFGFLLFLAQALESEADVTAADKLVSSISQASPPVTGFPTDLENPIWHRASHVTLGWNFSTRSPARFRTDAYLLFGPDAIYCAFLSDQSGTSITAQQTANDVGLGLDDYVSFAFDTSPNGTNEYFFETTPRGVRYEAASQSSRYRPQWQAKASVSGTSWFAEMIIPYRFLRVSASGGKTSWRLNFGRWVASEQYLYTWAFSSAMTSPYDQTFWPTLTDIPKIRSNEQGPTAQIYVLGNTGPDRNVFEGAAGNFQQRAGRNVGIDATYPITSSLSFDGTLNPDFSNVESDQLIIAPQEFRQQFAEYRPFFTQGATYLPTADVFYSPSIGVFDHGEKVEGTVDLVSIGALNVGASGKSDSAFDFAYGSRDQQLSFGFSGADAIRSGGSDEVYKFSVARTDIRSHFTVGASFAQENGAFTSTPSQAQYSSVYAQENRPNYSLAASYFDIGPLYSPLDAYVAIPGIRGPSISGSLSSTSKSGDLIRSLALSGYADRYVDDSGAVHEADTGLSGSISFKNLLAFSLSTNISSLRSYTLPYPMYLGGVTSPYDQSGVGFSYGSNTSSSIGASYSWGPYPGYYLQQLATNVSHQFGRHLSGSLQYQEVVEIHDTGPVNGQILRGVQLSEQFSGDETLSAALRAVSGTGGFSSPGLNLSAIYHRRFANASEIFAEFGSPAATVTLNRYIVKYVYRFGRGPGE